MCVQCACVPSTYYCRKYLLYSYIDFPKNPKKYQSTLFIVRISDWPVDSPFASGYAQHMTTFCNDISSMCNCCFGTLTNCSAGMKSLLLH